MIFSKNLLFSEAQAITADAKSTNVIDMSDLSALITTRPDMGVGVPIPILIQVVTNFVTIVNLTVSVEEDADNSGTFTKVISSPAIPIAQLVTGYQFSINWVPTNLSLRYVRLDYDVSTSATLGNITAGITMGNQSNFQA